MVCDCGKAEEQEFRGRVEENYSEFQKVANMIQEAMGSKAFALQRNAHFTLTDLQEERMSHAYPNLPVCLYASSGMELLDQ